VSMRGATNSVATCQLSAVRSLPHPGALGALEVFLNDMRYINPRFTYLLTYLLTYYRHFPPRTDRSIVFIWWRQCAPPTNTRFFGPTRVCSWTASRSVQPCLHDSLLCPTAYRQTDRHEDHEACNMCSNRPNVCHERRRFPPEP